MGPKEVLRGSKGSKRGLKESKGVQTGPKGSKGGLSEYGGKRLYRAEQFCKSAEVSTRVCGAL